jgi:hypothetical protein
MGESVDDRDVIGGSFDVDGLKKKYRRPDATSKPRNALASIEREILEEIASQSGRYGDRLDALLGAMATLLETIERTSAQLRHQKVDESDACHALDAGIAQYNRLRAQAQQVQHYLIIHREAMGFWNHDDVFRCYPIPAALTPPPPAQIPRLPEYP